MKMADFKSNLKTKLDSFKEHWNTPAEGNYVSYKEMVDVGLAGFGVHWTSYLASSIGLSASNFLVGASIGIRPLHLQIMLIIANLVGIPIAFFRSWFLDNHKMKGGKFIPIMLSTPIPIVLLSTLFVWLPYEHFNYSTKVVVVWFMYMIIQFFLCFYNEGWRLFQQVITPNAQERANAMSVFHIIYSLAPSITSLVIPTIAGLTWGMNNIKTYRTIYPIFTFIGVIILFIFFPRLKERIILPKRRVEYISIMDSLREVAKNKYFWIINVAAWIGFLEGSCGVLLGWTFVYGIGGKKQALLGLVNTLIGNASLWSMMLAPFMIKKLGKRNLLILHNAINVVVMTTLYFVYNNLALVCILFYINAFVNTFANIYMPNIQADMRDYHQWKTGVRVDGLFEPLALIGTVLGFLTGLVIPAIYERMGLKDDYNVLYDATIRNNLFRVLIICSIIGATLNLIPFLFYDLTEEKHRGYVNVLKIRAMFEDYGNGDLDDKELVDAMSIIETANEYKDAKIREVDKTSLKNAKKLPHKTKAQKNVRNEAISTAKKEIKFIKSENERIESLPIVLDELNKFNTLRYKNQLEDAKKTKALGEVYLYENWQDEMAKAKALPKGTAEEKEIRSDAIKLARSKKSSYKLLTKYGDSYIVPDDEIREQIIAKDADTLSDKIKQRKELKNYTKGVSIYRRITAPYYNANNLILQAENYTHLDDIKVLYNEALQRA